MSSLEVRVQEQQLVLADRAVVVEDQLAVPQPAHHLREILHLRRRHRRHTEGSVHRRDPAAEPEGEPAARQPVHGGGPRSGDQRMAGVVIGCGGGDLHPAGDGQRRTGERRRLLDVPAFGDESGAEAEFLATAGLVHQVAGPSPPAPANR